MVEIQQIHLIDLVGSLLFLFVAILFTYQTRSKNRDTPTLTYGFFIAFLGQSLNAITLILFDHEILTNLALIISLQYIFVTSINLILLFLWIFLERTDNVQISTNMVILVSVLIAADIVTFAMGFILENPQEALLYKNFIFTVLLNVLAYRCVVIQFRVFKATDKEKIALIQFLSLLFIWIWAFIGAIFNLSKIINFYNPSYLFPEILLSVGDYLYFGGLVMYILTFMYNPDYIYRLPLNIQDLVIFTDFGIAIYGIGKNAKEKSLDEQLLAGFVTATNSFVKEMMPKYEIEAIQTLISTNRIIRLEYGDSLGMCSVSTKENWYLRQSVRNFVRHLEEADPEKQWDSGMFFPDKQVREWLKIYFPYLEIDSMQTY